MKQNINYWSPDRIDETYAKIKIIYGLRSKGKTTGCLLKGLKNRLNDEDRKPQTAYIRRWEEEIKPKTDIGSLYDGILSFFNLDYESGGKYNTIIYKARKFYLARQKDGVTEYIDEKPLTICFAISQNEHYKSLSFPDVTTVVFDEFMSENHMYLPNEFKRYTSVISTIVRSRDDVDIYLLGNTVDLNCIYWNEFRIVELFKKIKPGELVHYKPQNHVTDIAIEYTDGANVNGRVLNVYTDFDSSNSDMINKGKWDTDNYPHLPCGYLNTDVVYSFIVEFNYELYQGDIIQIDDNIFIYIHRKTTPIKDEENDTIYTQEPGITRNRVVGFNNPQTKIQRLITTLFNNRKVFYQDNLVGDAIDAYIKCCSQN